MSSDDGGIKKILWAWSASFPKSPSTNIVATFQLDIWASKVYILYSKYAITWTL